MWTVANSQIEAGEEDTRCTREGGPGARAQEADLCALDHDAVDICTVPMAQKPFFLYLYEALFTTVKKSELLRDVIWIVEWC